MRLKATKTPVFDHPDFAGDAILKRIAREEYRSIVGGGLKLPSVSSATKASSHREKHENKDV